MTRQCAHANSGSQYVPRAHTQHLSTSRLARSDAADEAGKQATVLGAAICADLDVAILAVQQRATHARRVPLLVAVLEHSTEDGHNDLHTQTARCMMGNSSAVDDTS